ncbi:hypothetical protein BN1723_001845, partial [Verticillium longisporum]
MADADRDLEKADADADADADTTFAPIRTDPRATPDAQPRRLSTASARSVARTISRARSHNGYSCDDYQPSSDDNEPSASSTDAAAAGAARARSKEDPFEVSFENGDRDPWCPRATRPAGDRGVCTPDADALVSTRVEALAAGLGSGLALCCPDPCS